MLEASRDVPLDQQHRETRPQCGPLICNSRAHRTIGLAMWLLVHACLSFAGAAPTDFPPGAKPSSPPSQYFTFTQPEQGDTGINVLVDTAHEFYFAYSWTVPSLLREIGFRAIASEACLDGVLKPGRPVNALLYGPRDDRVGTWPCPDFSVVITSQLDPNAQKYLPEEVESLREFVLEDGGGLLLIGGAPMTEKQAFVWPLNRVVSVFGARIGTETTELRTRKVPVLHLGDEWQVRLRGVDGAPVFAARDFGKGRVALMSSFHILHSVKGDPDPNDLKQTDVQRLLKDLIMWLGANRSPGWGPRQFPCVIYPENLLRVDNAVVAYASNQRPELIECVKNDMPDARRRLTEWLPIAPRTGAFPLVLAAGGGGGWAAGDEVGTIALDPEGLLGVFVHELAHTMPGPDNAAAQQAGRLPGLLFGEAHAGWFQRKIVALRGGDIREDDWAKSDPTRRALDLAKASQSEVGSGWQKLWYVYQKLDDRYGTTWFPRWIWVKNTRWAATPQKTLTWDEVVEDMSIAVGEDLFPFFRALGTSLSKERCPSLVFQGQMLQLPVAPVAATPAGPYRFEPARDYRQPLKPCPVEVVAPPVPTEAKAWPAAYAAALGDAKSLGDFHINVGAYGGNAVPEGQAGTRVFGVWTNTALWARPVLGDQWLLTTEMAFAGNGRDGESCLWLAGPGRGSSSALGYFLQIRPGKECALWRQNVTVRRFDMSATPAANGYYSLQVLRQAATIQLWVDGQQLLTYTDRTPLAGPLHGQVAVGCSGGGFVGGVRYRNLRLQVPTAANQSTRTVAPLTPLVTTAPAANGKLLADLAATGNTPAWFRFQPEFMHWLPDSLVLTGPNGRPFLMHREGIFEDFAIETEMHYVPKVLPEPRNLPNDIAQRYLAAGGAETGFCLMAKFAEALPADETLATESFPGGWEFGFDQTGPRLRWTAGKQGEDWESDPYWSPVDGHTYRLRLEVRRNRLRAFMDGGIVFDSEVPEHLWPQGRRGFVGLRQGFEGVVVHGLRVYTL